MVFMSRLVTLQYMMIDLVSDSIKWNMFTQQNCPVAEWIECSANISGVTKNVDPLNMFYKELYRSLS